MTNRMTDAECDELLRQIDEAAGRKPLPLYEVDPLRPMTIQINGYASSLLDALTDKINAQTGKKYTVEEVAAQMVLRELRKVRL